jgi:outer membrane protein OmpA-like peptidoglycan-associated protein
MKLKIIFIFLLSISFCIYGQKDFIEIKGNIVDDEDAFKKIPALKVMLTFNDTLAVETNADSLGNYSFKISRNFTKNYKIHLIAFQDYQAAKKMYPTNKECPYFDTYFGYLYNKQKIEIHSDSSSFTINLKMNPVKADMRLPTINFEKNSTNFTQCGYFNADTSIICIKKMLEENPTIIIELLVHSWNEKNMHSLSEKRAKVVINHLVELGINSKRIKTTLWLDKKPLIRPETIKRAQSVEEKEKFECTNRRITYRVVSWEFK